MHARRVCGCGRTVASGQRCPCRIAKDRQRPSARDRGYDTKWERESAAFLAIPGNEMCACGCGRRADMVDHIIAHKGNKKLFWDKKNWQPFNRRCNSRKAARSEGGFGRPIREESDD